MANKWDPIDPADILDLWVDFGGTPKPFLPVTETIADHTVNAPPEVTIVTSDVDGQKIRWRTGPNPAGRYLINFHITTDPGGEEYDVDVWLTVAERIKK